MESHNSPISTYTAPTCTLKVSSKTKQLSHSDLQPPQHGGNFVLEIDHPDRGELERTTLQGDLQSLNQLQLVVSNYITDLIAKFPLPNAINAQPLPEAETDTPIDRAVPEARTQSPTSGTNAKFARITQSSVSIRPRQSSD